MRKRLKQAAVALVIVLAAAQLVRPDRTNPPIDASRTIQGQMGAESKLVAVLNRSCSDCHSNLTVWPWYTEIAPVSWLMAYGVKKGRDMVNFSEWAGYPPDHQRVLLVESCQDVTQGTMPGLYTWLHPGMRLSPQDIDAICAAAREVEENAARH